jgi:hypothetical protein
LIEIAGGEVKTLPPFVFSRKVEEVVEPVKQTQFSFAPYREFAVQPETANESVPLRPQPSMVSQGIYVLQEGDPTPKVQNSFARNGVGYQLALNSRWLGIGAGAVFFPRERKGSVLDRGESGYLLLNVNLTEEFSVQFQQGIRNKVIEDDDLTVSYYFRQGFKKVGLHFILLPRTSYNFGYFMDLGGVTFSSPFRLEKPTLTYYLALGMEI